MTPHHSKIVHRLACEVGDPDTGDPICTKLATFRHPDPDGDFYYCAEHAKGCPDCVSLKREKKTRAQR